MTMTNAEYRAFATSAVALAAAEAQLADRLAEALRRAAARCDCSRTELAEVLADYDRART